VNPPASNRNLDQIVNAVNRNAIGVYNISVTIDYPGIGAPPTVCNYRTCPVTVDATAQFIPLPSQFMLGSTFRITLRGGSQLFIER